MHYRIQLVLETIQNIEESKSTQINIFRTIFMVKTAWRIELYHYNRQLFWPWWFSIQQFGRENIKRQ